MQRKKPKKVKKVKIRSIQKIKALCETQQIVDIPFGDYFKQMLTKLINCKRELEVFLQLTDANDDTIIHLYQSIEDLLTNVTSIESVIEKFPGLILTNKEEMLGYVKLLKNILLFVNDINQKTELLFLTHLTLNNEQIFFSELLLKLLKEVSFIFSLMRNKFIYSSVHTKETYASNDILPHYLEVLLFLQCFRARMLSNIKNLEGIDKDDASKEKMVFDKYNDFISAEIHQLSIARTPYLAYLEVSQILLSDDFECIKQRHENLIKLKYESCTLQGFKFYISAALLHLASISLNNTPQDVLSSIDWLNEISSLGNLCNQGQEPILLKTKENLLNHFMILYYHHLTSLPGFYKTLEDFATYLDSKNKYIRIMILSSTAHTERLAKHLRASSCDCQIDEDQQSILIYPAIHFVKSETLLAALIKFAEKLELAKRKLPTYFEPEMAPKSLFHSAETIVEEEEKEKEKEKEKEADEYRNVMNEQAKKLKNIEKEKALNKIAKKREVVIEHEEIIAENTLKKQLPGKNTAYYHLSLSDKVRSKLTNEIALSKAEKMLKEGKDIIFFKIAPGQRIAKLRIGGENERLFACIKKIDKDEKGFKHYDVTFDTIRTHRKG